MIFLLLVSALIFLLFYPSDINLNFNHQEPSGNTIEENTEPAPESDQTWPVAVMIDNHPEARPFQAGTQDAFLVYSTLVEGSYTRLMAVFKTANAAKIGPVRSARPYFVRLAKETDALYVHSGGSAEAIKTIEILKVNNLEEATSYGPLYIWRDKNIAAPHNLFTSSANLERARQDWQLSEQTPVYPVWKFKSNATSTPEVNAQEVYIKYSPVDYFNVTYKYDSVLETYLRSQGSEPHIDQNTGEQIQVKNIVIQFVPEEIHLDAQDRLAITLSGSGGAWIINDGHVIHGGWQKQGNQTRTIFYDGQEKEIEFTPGNIWVEIVPGDREVTVK